MITDVFKIIQYRSLLSSLKVNVSISFLTLHYYLSFLSYSRTFLHSQLSYQANHLLLLRTITVASYHFRCAINSFQGLLLQRQFLPFHRFMRLVIHLQLVPGPPDFYELGYSNRERFLKATYWRIPFVGWDWILQCYIIHVHHVNCFSLEILLHLCSTSVSNQASYSNVENLIDLDEELILIVCQVI